MFCSYTFIYTLRGFGHLRWDSKIFSLKGDGTVKTPSVDFWNLKHFLYIHNSTLKGALEFIFMPYTFLRSELKPTRNRISATNGQSRPLMTLALESAGVLVCPFAQRCARSLRYVIKRIFRLWLAYTRMHTWKRSLQLCCLLSSPLQRGVGPRGQTSARTSVTSACLLNLFLTEFARNAYWLVSWFVKDSDRILG